MNDVAYRRWVCDACGYIYDEAKGDPDEGFAPGTRFEDIPDDWQCPLCGLSKSDLRVLPEQPRAPLAAKSPRVRTSGSKCRGGDDYIVIVGAGIAGWSVAEAIREQDKEVPLLLISSCAGISYSKPALSTALAQGKSVDDLAEQDAVSKAAMLEMDVRTETRLIRIDPKKKRLTTAKGGIQYGKLVLALGAHPRKLEISGDAADTVLSVNDLMAYRKLRTRLQDDVKHVTILGAGLIGCEFAADLSAAGYRVSVVDPADYPLSSLLPEDTAMQLREHMQAEGAQWYFQTSLDSLEYSGSHMRATLSNGEAFETDLVLASAGLLANIELAEKAGLAVGKGINTDRLMRTSEIDIYAIGDCAAVEGQIFAYIEPIRRQAETIAADLRGDSQPFEAHSPLVRVKIPSFPLTICPPESDSGLVDTPHPGDVPGRINYLRDDQIVGFVLSGEQASHGANLYRQLFS